MRLKKVYEKFNKITKVKNTFVSLKFILNPGWSVTTTILYGTY